MRILFVGSWYPYPPDNGSRTRYYNLIRELSKRHRISLVSFYTDDRPMSDERIEAMRPFCDLIETVPRPMHTPGRNIRYMTSIAQQLPPEIALRWNPAMAGRVRDALDSGGHDMILLAHVLNLMLLDHVALDIPIILDEFQATRAYQRASNANTLSRLKQAHRSFMWTTFFDKRLPKLAGITVPSIGEHAIAKQLLEKSAADIPVEIVSNGVDLAYNRPGLAFSQPEALMYQGALSVPANFDAVQHFMSEVMPFVSMTHPNARLKVTGDHDGVDVSHLGSSGNLELTGYLEDVRPAIASASVCVVPLRIGAGTRLKVLEAMALGTPVVTTHKGIEGIDAVHGEHALIADDPRQFADYVVQLLDDSKLRARLAANGRRLVEERYGWEQIGARLSAFCEQVAGG